MVYRRDPRAAMMPVMSIVRIVPAVALSALALSLTVGCNTDPGKDKAKAQVAEAVTVTQAAPAAGAVTYAFSQDGSKVEYVGAKITKKHDGGFGKFSGTIQSVGADPTKSSVKVDIDMSSITSDVEKLTGHLKSGDFFDVEKYPKANFTSTSIAAGGENGASHTVTGNLEIRGVTKAVTFPAKIKAAPDAVDVDAEFAINRKDWGIVYAGAPDDLIKDQVLIKLTIRAKKSG